MFICLLAPAPGRPNGEGAGRPILVVMCCLVRCVLLLYVLTCVSVVCMCMFVLVKLLHCLDVLSQNFLGIAPRLRVDSPQIGQGGKNTQMSQNMATCVKM